MAKSILEDIFSQKKREVELAQRQIPLAELERIIQQQSYIKRDFIGVLRDRIAQNKNTLIAEIKKASPSKGVIREQFHPRNIAKAYEDAGASCLSILTDVDYFQGDIAYLNEVRQVVNLPLLRKDFIYDIYQLYETKAYGADCVLLIAAILSEQQLALLYKQAIDLDLDVLVEVHDAQQMNIARDLNCRMIGINNRDLRSFVTDLSITENLSVLVEDDTLIICESGIDCRADVERINRANVYGFLIGEGFIRHLDIGAAVRDIFGETL